MIENRFGTIFQDCNISNGKLITFSYMDIMMGKLRGILRACIRPIPFNSLIKIYHFEESNLQVNY